MFQRQATFICNARRHKASNLCFATQEDIIFVITSNAFLKMVVEKRHVEITLGSLSTLLKSLEVLQIFSIFGEIICVTGGFFCLFCARNKYFCLIWENTCSQKVDFFELPNIKKHNISRTYVLRYRV